MKKAIEKHLGGVEQDRQRNLQDLPDDVRHYLHEKFLATKK
jgi:hypothetical protein